jgi:hypothetical protein
VAAEEKRIARTYNERFKDWFYRDDLAGRTGLTEESAQFKYFLHQLDHVNRILSGLGGITLREWGLKQEAGMENSPQMELLKALALGGGQGLKKKTAELKRRFPGKELTLVKATETPTAVSPVATADPSAGGSAPCGSGGGGGASGTYPNEPFNGLQIQYTVSGAGVGAPEDRKGMTTSRKYTGTLAGGTLAVSGTAKAGSYNDSFPMVLEVVLRAGDQSEEYRDETKGAGEGWSSSFSVSIPVPEDAEGGSFAIQLTYVNPRFGDRTLSVYGDLTC